MSAPRPATKDSMMAANSGFMPRSDATSAVCARIGTGANCGPYRVYQFAEIEIQGPWLAKPVDFAGPGGLRNP